MTTPAQFIAQDGRLEGVSAIASLGFNRYALCTPLRRAIVLAEMSGYFACDDTGDIGSEPGCIMLFQGRLWTVCLDGSVRSFSLDNIPLPLSSTAVGASINAWITSSGSVIIAPARTGGIVSLSAAGAQLHVFENVLSQISFAIASGGYVYAFDAHGNGAVLAVDGTTGVFTWVGTFAATNVQGPVAGFVVGSTLSIAALQRQAVIAFDLTIPTAPVVLTYTTYDIPGPFLGLPVSLHGLFNDGVPSPLMDSPSPTIPLVPWWSATGAVTDGTTAVVAFGASGRLGFYTTSVNGFGVRYLTEGDAGTNLFVQESVSGSHFLTQGRPL